ncbi:MAG: phage integrase N-terminal SAM-like domain-containing protein [Methylobacter sp.]|nr:phage integrase N-terminal SAM-like domain-containing protein [Methylobacter sp.]
MQTNTTSAQPKKLLDQVRDKIRFKHYSLSTEKTYIAWIKQFHRSNAPRWNAKEDAPASS